MSEIVGLSGLPLNPDPVESAPVEPKATQLPVPATYHLLCAVPDMGGEFENGIAKAKSTIQFEELLTTVLFVVKMGPDAYADAKRFPSGPSCKEGDFVLVRPNSGTRFKIHDREFRIINDESVEATVDDPRSIRRP